jgi:RNA polymerase sigma-B factor
MGFPDKDSSMMATQSAVCSYQVAPSYSLAVKDWGSFSHEAIESHQNDISRRQLKAVSHTVKTKKEKVNREVSCSPSHRTTVEKCDWESKGIELLMTYHKNPSVLLRNQLVKLHAGLVRKVAHRIRYQCTEPYEDLEQIGFIGLIRAIERFDPSQGCAFSSFAVPYIRGEMLHFLRDKSSIVKIPRRWQELYTEGEKVQKELTVKLGRTPKDAEIAQVLQVSVQEWRESKLAVQNRQPLSLDATVGRQVDYPVSLGDTLPDTHYQTLQYLAEDRQQLQDALGQLETKTRAAIECVYLKDLPRKEAAKQIGVSPMTVTRHLQKGVEQLVTLLQPQATELAS